MSPVFDRFGILSITLPVVVGVRTSAPSAASFTVTGRSSRMLSPSRVKIAMRPHGNLHQRVAGRAFAGRGRSLAAQAQDLPVLDACGNRHIQGSPCGRVIVLVAPLTASRNST